MSFDDTSTSPRQTEVSKDDEDQTPLEHRIPFAWWTTGLFLSAVMSCAILVKLFHMNVREAILALILGFLFSFIGVQSSGATDINPASTASQLIFGGVGKGSGLELKPAEMLNLAAGVVSAGSAAQASDMTGDLKTGYLLGAKPRNHFIAQLCGSVVAVFLTSGLFILFTKATPCILYGPEENGKHLLSTLDVELLAPSPAYRLPQVKTSVALNTQGVSWFNLRTPPPEHSILVMEFWDYDPSTGPSNSWTIHGQHTSLDVFVSNQTAVLITSNSCDSTYDENCDPSRAYTDIASLLTDNDAGDTLSYMQTYWVDIDGDNEEFWEHEWSTHGTCFSTLELDCFSGIIRGQEVQLGNLMNFMIFDLLIHSLKAVAYFQSVVALFKSLPTYEWLANKGITPSSSTSYSLSKVIAALEEGSGGYTPALDCDGSNLNQIYWYFHLKGSVVDGAFVPISAPEAGSCGSTVKYPPKSSSSTPTSTTTSSSPSGTSGRTLPAKVTVMALQSGSEDGGLLSLGTWSTQTLATFTTTGDADSFTMTSSKGNCGVCSGALTCGSGVSLSTFSTILSNGDLLLSYNGETDFSSDGSPGGTTVYTVYVGSSHDEIYSLSIHEK
ncbi:ribonuclease T2 [Guyanagaster necrorhizus]|uniref:ribonuclease T2 n=1 Tax=Guyanagaster necrorhizus TaxID=856835 RepID=A0A9P8AZT2_9AGAR|nr:ribonuclease T2 [Guyanagaster necrorhizus MCA 3950]KAG7452272.1 ribonuclease T2 [Guyanagaster necrorhizus MCA 3950]